MQGWKVEWPKRDVTIAGSLYGGDRLLQMGRFRFVDMTYGFFYLYFQIDLALCPSALNLVYIT
jgi:hypothetical protein